MKKILIVLSLTIIPFAWSCKDDDYQSNEIQGDYVADFGDYSDATYELMGRPNGAPYFSKNGKYIYEINVDKPFSLVYTIPGIFEDARFRALAAVDNNRLYYLAGTNSYVRNDINKIYSFDASGQPQLVFTFQPGGAPYAPKVNISAIAFDGEHSFYVFDAGYHQMKRWMPEMNGEIVVAGSEQNAMTDGVGLSASLSNVSKIVSHKGYIYFIDDDGQYNALRRMSKTSYEVETILKRKSNGSSLDGVNNYLSMYDFALDSKDNIYISTKDTPYIYLLSPENVLSPFFSSLDIQITKPSPVSYGLSWFGKSSLWIDANDTMYCAKNYLVLKISNFKVQIEEYNRKKEIK